MVKYLTEVEVSVGHETYKLSLESEKPMDYNDNHYYIDDVMVSKVKTFQSTNNIGPFAAKQFYQRLKFPMQSTIYSEQRFEYGGDTNNTNNR